MSKVRLQKYLAEMGIASRRTIESWITEQRIKVNGKWANLGIKVDSSDAIELDGELVQQKSDSNEVTKVWIYNKPKGVICSRHDPEGRPTVFEKVAIETDGRLLMVGRLDFNTEGLLLLTNDGALAHCLTHPKFGVKRVYRVRVSDKLTSRQEQMLLTGVKLEDGMACFESLASGEQTKGQNFWYTVSLREGRNREVRRLFESQGLNVSRLMRIEFAGMHLPKDLKTNQCRLLDDEATQVLLAIK